MNRVIGPQPVLRLPSARIAIVVLLGIAVLTVFGSTLAPQNPLTVNANALFQGPSAHHWLGTDYLGRDVLSRLMAGTRLSVLTALEAVGIGLVVVEGSVATRGAASGRLDLDYIGTRAGEQLTAELALFIAQFQNPDVGEKSIGHRLHPCCYGRRAAPAARR